jgi:hypothetical protein
MTLIKHWAVGGWWEGTKAIACTDNVLKDSDYTLVLLLVMLVAGESDEDDAGNNHDGLIVVVLWSS